MKRSFLFCLILLLLSSTAHAVLKAHPTNPRYFINGVGKPVYLTGSHTWDLIQWDTTRASEATEAEFDAFLNWSHQHGHNFIRLWTNMSYKNYSPYPWQRPGPGTAAMDGKPKFDMTKFNQTYFNMLKGRIQKIQNRGMYASVMFFGSFNPLRSDFQNTAWNEKNNINSALASTFSSTDGFSFCTINAAALDIERSLVRKTIDELNSFDNILWEIVNEMGGTPTHCVNWQRSMIDYVKQYESTKAKQHPVLMTGGYSLGNHMLTGNHDAISPDIYSMGYYEGGPADFTDYVVISDTDHIRNPQETGWGYSYPQFAEDMRKWVWKTFSRGNNPIFMDTYKAYKPDLNNKLGVINPIFDGVRRGMGYTSDYFDRFSDPAAMIPSANTTHCSTTYCLRNPGKAYLIYQPNTGAFTVNLLAGEYRYEWFHPTSGIVRESGAIRVAAGNRSFAPPFSGEAVLYLWKDTTVLAPPAGLSTR